MGGQRVLSLSRTRARIVGVVVWCGRGGFSDACVVCAVPLLFLGVSFAACTRCGPRSSGRWVNVGMVRCGRNWEGCRRRVCTAWLKPRRLELGEPAILDEVCGSRAYILSTMKWHFQGNCNEAESVLVRSGCRGVGKVLGPKRKGSLAAKLAFSRTSTSILVAPPAQRCCPRSCLEFRKVATALLIGTARAPFRSEPPSVSHTPPSRWASSRARSVSRSSC